jgi:co-chaperonin GroES (HSP10)
VENNSGLEPVGVAVLIKMYEPERKDGMIVIPDAVQGKMAQVDVRATVVAVGPGAWEEEKRPRAAPGDRVMVTKFAGFIAKGPKDGQLYRLINDRDIFCKIVEENENV